VLPVLQDWLPLNFNRSLLENIEEPEGRGEGSSHTLVAWLLPRAGGAGRISCSAGSGSVVAGGLLAPHPSGVEIGGTCADVWDVQVCVVMIRPGSGTCCLLACLWLLPLPDARGFTQMWAGLDSRGTWPGALGHMLAHCAWLS